MQLVIIAGGFGTRLRPLTLNRPKALVPLVDRPQIAYTLDSLPAICDEVIIAVNYGFEPMVFDFIEAGRAVSLERDVFPRLVERGLTAYRYDGYWSDAGTLPSYLNAQRVLLDAGRGKIAPEADVTSGSLRPPVYIGAGSYVEGRLGPHVVLGKSCKIGRASLTNAALLEGVSVDDKAEISSSILGAGASIGEGAHVRDSIVGDAVQVPAYATIFDDRVSA